MLINHLDITFRHLFHRINIKLAKYSRNLDILHSKKKID